MAFKWENGKKLTMTYVSSGNSPGYVAPAATASGMSTQRDAEWQRGFDDGLKAVTTRTTIRSRTRTA